MEATRYDAVPFKATISPEGYLTDSPILARVGVQTYRDRNGREWREYRPPEAVFAPEHLAAIRGRPIIDGHIARVDAANARAHTIGTILSEGRQDGDHLRADIIIHDPTPVLKGGKRELSLGYRVKVRDEPGTTPNGERYDRIVEQIAMVDHLAIVPKGRAGVARLNLDADDAVSFTDDEEADLADKLATVRLDGGLTYEAPPEVAQALEAARAALTAANERADRAEAARDGLQAKVDGFEAEKTKIRADAAAEARARLALEAEAAKHGIEVRGDMADRAIREAVIVKVRGATEFANRSDDYVSAAFDMAVQDAKARNDAASQQRSQSNGGAPRQDADLPKAIRSAAAARDAMIRSNRI
ncbi:hypothetical protein HMPREF9946_03135 [Acetobacteraceae bacterium AT-5844]|nr:hypothetical protein HMPREF9946_03135 [Acetobacteraceae bacterium AT-5844]